jgi:hypothetical protein
LGGNAAGLKDQVRRARQLAEQGGGGVTQAMQDAVSLFMRLQGELARRAPAPVSTMLDELVRA